MGTSGWGELQEFVQSGKLRAIAITAPARLKGVPVATLKEQGVNVEIGNWRGVYAPRASRRSSARPWPMR